MEIIPPDTHIAENNAMYTPVSLSICPGLVINTIPKNPKNIKTINFKFNFSENIKNEIKQVKKTFVNSEKKLVEFDLELFNWEKLDYVDKLKKLFKLAK